MEAGYKHTTVHELKKSGLNNNKEFDTVILVIKCQRVVFVIRSYLIESFLLSLSSEHKYFNHFIVYVEFKITSYNSS